MQKKYLYISFFSLAAFLACHQKETASEEEEVSQEEIQTPVTVTTVSIEPLSDYVELNATSSFLQDNIVKSNINGYIKAVIPK